MDYNKEYRCCLTGSLIEPERVEVLFELGIHPDDFTIVSVSETPKIKEAPSIGVAKVELGDVEAEALNEELVG